MRIVAVCLLSFVSFALIGQDTALFQKKKYIYKGDTIPYRILFPKNYKKSNRYPLILFLHGAGERGNDNQKQLIHGASLFTQASNRENFPAIVVAPQCPLDSYWSSVAVDRSTSPIGLDFNYDSEATKPLALAVRLVQHLANEEAVDKKQIFITGLSMGGMGTFEAVYRHPKLFAAALPICGGGDRSAYGKKQARIPFWIFHGDADPVVSVEESREMVEKLKALNAEVKYTEYAGVGHNSWDFAFAEADFLRWMFSKRRK